MKQVWMGLMIGVPLAAAASAGVVYEIEVKDHGQSPPKVETMEAAVEGKNLRMGIGSGGDGKQGTMIYRGDRREMVVVDPEAKSYTVVDREGLGQLAGQVHGAMAQMQAALENVPEDQRKMVEEMIKRRMPQSTAPPELERSELRQTGERADKNGYPCVKYEVHKAGQKIREMWVTEWNNLEGGDEMIGAFEEMAGFFEELMASIPNFGLRDDGFDSVFEHVKELGGFPVVTREFDADGSVESESFLRSSSRRAIDPADFEPPAGYKRRSMFPSQ